MLVTKFILYSYALLLLITVFREWKLGIAAFAISDLLLAVLLVLATRKLEESLKRNYRLLAGVGVILSASFFLRLALSLAFYPWGYLWCASMVIALLTWIKSIQDI